MQVGMRLKQLLRAAVYGCYSFAPKRFSWVYDQHVRNVMEYFEDRPDDLLVLNIFNGEGFEKLAEFLGRPEPSEPFPHKGAVLSRHMAEQRLAAHAADG